MGAAAGKGLVSHYPLEDSFQIKKVRIRILERAKAPPPLSPHGLLSSMSVGAIVLYRSTRVGQFERRLSSSTIDIDRMPSICEKDRIDGRDEKERIARLIMSPPASEFHVYTGPRRAGKSQAMMEVVDDLRKKGVKGVHYVTAERPLYRSLVDAFFMDDASVMKGYWRGLFDRKSPFPQNQTTPEEALKQVTDRLAKSAKKYEGGRLTTIIIDGVNSLTPPHLPLSEEEHLQGSETRELRRMVEIAKKHIDRRHIHWILVDSSGVALDIMYTTSASSRLEMVLSNDVSKKAATDYLKKRFEAAGKSFDANCVYEDVTGGRIGLLHDVANAVEKAKTKEGLYESVLEKKKKNSPKAALKRVFPEWPRTETADKKFKYRILRLLAKNQKRKEKDNELRIRAGKPEFEGVNRTAAMRTLFKFDLLRYASGSEVALHSNAIRHLVLSEGLPLEDEK